MDKIKLIVMNEHTLGYILPETPKYISILHTSLLKGSTFNAQSGPIYIGSQDTIRLASDKDFEEYRVCFEGYKNNSQYIFK
jgi:hypothetical protein